MESRVASQTYEALVVQLLVTEAWVGRPDNPTRLLHCYHVMVACSCLGVESMSVTLAEDFYLFLRSPYFLPEKQNTQVL